METGKSSFRRGRQNRKKGEPHFFPLTPDASIIRGHLNLTPHSIDPIWEVGGEGTAKA